MENTNSPLVSIGLPVYNGDNFLQEALDSILAQTYEDFELIISNNASTDSTEEICREYAAKDQRIRYYCNEKNLGAARNYNLVFELSQGEYFKWIAHDDLYAPESLERCVQVLNQMPSVVLCYPKTKFIDELGKPIKDYQDNFNLCSSTPHERYKTFLRVAYDWYGFMNPIFGLIRTNVLKQTKLHGSFASSDKILLGELALLGEFYEVPEYLFFRRDHPKRSVLLAPTFKERNLWFDPTYKGKGQMTRWRWLFEHLESINRVPMSWSEKAFCYLYMVDWIRRRRARLAEDLANVAKTFFEDGTKNGLSDHAKTELDK